MKSSEPLAKAITRFFTPREIEIKTAIAMQTSIIQRQAFPDGGFVLHKIKDGSFSGHASAWYDKDGKLLDAEVRLSNGQTRKAGENARLTLEMAGRMYRTPQA